jgi:membrane protein DedA with SNARE-associated domain
MVFSDVVPVLLALIQQHGVLAVVTAVVVEEVIAPIPSQPIVMGAAFFLVDANLSLSAAAPELFLLVVLPAALAGTVSSYVWFGAAYYGGKPVIMRFRKLLRVSWEDVERMEDRLQERKWDAGLVTLFRSIPVIPVIAITVAGGTVRMNPATYGVATFTGMLIRNAILAYLGWQSRSLYNEYAAVFQQVETYVVIGIVVLSAAAVFLHYRRSRDNP